MKSFAMAAAAFASAASAQSMFEEIVDDNFLGRELEDDSSTYAADVRDRCCVVYEK